jgi:hypothetical protein
MYCPLSVFENSATHGSSMDADADSRVHPFAHLHDPAYWASGDSASESETETESESETEYPIHTDKWERATSFDTWIKEIALESTYHSNIFTMYKWWILERDGRYDCRVFAKNKYCAWARFISTKPEDSLTGMAWDICHCPKLSVTRYKTWLETIAVAFEEGDPPIKWRTTEEIVEEIKEGTSILD